MDSMTSEEIFNVLNGINIPPQPELLVKLNEEVKTKEPSLTAVSELIANDVAVSASVLKTVNSAYFGLKSEVLSIKHAISLLGLPTTTNLVKGFMLKQAMGESVIKLPRFWDAAENIAKSSAYIARKLGIMDADPPYTLGLFHDVGIPLLVQRYPNYLDILKQANETPNTIFTEIEDESLNSNHAIVGFILSREWGLPRMMRQALLMHHDIESIVNVDTPTDSYIAKLISILKLAEMTDSVMRTGLPDNDWLQFGGPVMDFLSLSEPDVNDLVEDVRDLLGG